jgi:hypothetical protein
MPEAAGVESARMLANEARERLQSQGLDDPTIDKLADRFVGEDRGEDVDVFIEWAQRQDMSVPTPEDMSEDSFPASDPPSTWATAGGAAPRPEAR